MVIKQLDEDDEMEGSDDDEEEEDDESEEESEEEEAPAPKSAKRKPVAPEPVIAKKAKADTPAEAKKPESKKEVNDARYSARMECCVEPMCVCHRALDDLI